MHGDTDAVKFLIKPKKEKAVASTEPEPGNGAGPTAHEEKDVPATPAKYADGISRKFGRFLSELEKKLV